MRIKSGGWVGSMFSITIKFHFRLYYREFKNIPRDTATSEDCKLTVRILFNLLMSNLFHI